MHSLISEMCSFLAPRIILVGENRAWKPIFGGHGWRTIQTAITDDNEPDCCIDCRPTRVSVDRIWASVKGRAVALKRVNVLSLLEATGSSAAMTGGEELI